MESKFYDYLEKYKSIIIAIFSVILFLSAIEKFNEDIWHTVDAIVTIATVIGVWYNYHQNQLQIKKEMEKVEISFLNNGKKYILDLDIPRKHISRSEIQGILGAFQKNISQRYSIEYLSHVDFLDAIYKIQNKEKNYLEIIITDKELNGYHNHDKDFHDGFNKDKMKNHDL